MSFKKYAIYVESSKLSVESVKNVIRVAREVGEVEITPFNGHDRYEFKVLREKYPFVLLDKEECWDKFSYLQSTIGCFHSHFALWEKCVKSNEKIMVVEHDTIFLQKYVDFDFEGVITFGKPLWNILRNKDIRYLIGKNNNVKLLQWDCDCSGPPTYEHTRHLSCKPNGCNSWNLQGAHGYTITPKAAEKLIEKSYEFGIVPADLHLNRYNIEIANTYPYMSFQDSKFSLCTKHYDSNFVNKLNSDWVEGEEAWKV